MEFNSIFLSNSKYRILWHAIFWIVVLAYYTFFFGHQGGFYWFTLKFVVILLPVAIGTTYLFNYFLIPKFLLNNKLKTFSLLSIYALIGSFYIVSLIIFPFLIISKNEVNFVTLDKSFLDIYFLIAGLYTAVLFAILIKLIKSSYEKQHQHMEMLKEKTAAELEVLKSQINPHFLFNTLNNIYTLALKKSDLTPEVVLKLSEILDYLLYECNADFVPLQKEIYLIQNYLYLQTIRFDKRLKTTFDVDGKTANKEIAPMLLLPFIENSFKHGVGKYRNNAWIKIKLKNDEKTMDFEVSNSHAPELENEIKNASGGIGLKNVRKRLELIYKNRHHLQLSNSKTEFKVALNLKL